LLREYLTIYGSGKINVNLAHKEVLLYVPIITPDIADAIIEFRKKNGEIKSVTDLEEIFGPYGIIGEELQKTMELLTLDNSNFVTINSISTFEKVKNSYKLIVQKGAGSCSIIAAYPE
jgi:general secretion pathway protein K